METKKQLIDIFGEAGVIDDAAELEKFAASEGFVSGFVPQYIVKPTKATQVEEFIKWANETKTTVVTVSSGGRHRRGGTVPYVPEAIILDLSGMKKIIDANETFRIAVFEAGVTYGELAPVLAEKGLMIDTCLAPRAEKSVLASLLDVEPRLNPNMQWTSPDPLRITEVVWGDGNRMRTGEAYGMPMDKDDEEVVKLAHSKHAMLINANGPELIDYYRLITGSQATLGAVTWASVKTARLPQAEQAFLAGSDDLNKLVDWLYAVEHLRFGDSLFVMNAFDLACLIGKDKDEIKAIQAGLPKYVGFCTAAGRDPIPEMRSKAHANGIAEAARQSKVEFGPVIGGVFADKVRAAAFTPCAEGDYWKDRFSGNSADIFFLTQMENVPKFEAKMRELATAYDVDASSIGMYVQPKHQGVNCQVEFTIPYCCCCKDKVQKFFEAAAKELGDIGAYYSKPYGTWADIQFGKDAAGANAFNKLKNIFDPNDVMNTGKFRQFS